MTTIKGETYRPTQMTPREQFHVSRRLSPLVGTMGDGILALLDGSTRAEAMTKLARDIGPLTNALAFMPDSVLDEVIDTCLLHTERLNKDTGTWHPIYIRNGKDALRMFKDVDLYAEMVLVAECFKENLAPFFSQLNGGAAPSVSANGAAAGSNT